MKIAIEAQRIMRDNKHGMDFVALETIREIQKMDSQNEYYILVSPGSDHCLQESDNMHIVEVKCPSYPLWEQVALPLALNKIKPDLVHCTSNTAPIFCKYPLVLTLHDIIFLEKRHGKSRSMYQNLGWYYRRFVVPRVLPKCKTIITVSEFERERISQALGLSSKQLIAIHNGFGTHFKPLQDYGDVVRKYIDAPEYLFFLGNTDPKKNTTRTLIAYAIYARASKNPLPLLIADLKQNVVDDILKEHLIEDVGSLIRCAGYISNSDLPYIYSGARAFLYTSLRESFGIPLLEAMACGTPVITSSISAIPEVAGPGAIMVDPMCPEMIAEQIMRLESDSDYRAAKIEYGLQRVKLFSWRQTALKLLSVYNS